jgi:amidophosphoribosyltransferase
MSDVEFIGEKCGVISIARNSPIPFYMYYALRAIQHRGQEASGMALFNPDEKKIVCTKGLGLVESVFRKRQMEELKGNMGIGHTYYSIRLSKPENAQPHLIKTAAGDIALAHNGIIVNSGQLIQELKAKGHAFVTDTEEEAMAYILAEELFAGNDIVKATKKMVKKLVGSYALSIMIGERVFALRDPLGIRPLCLGKFKDGSGYIAASESVALDVIDAELIRDVAPGELLELKPDGIESNIVGTVENKSYCFFEHVYFARPDSVIEGHSVYETRKRIGSQIAKEQPVNADVVVPIPDSGRAHAQGFSDVSGIPMAEGLIKNRYINRTFIMPDQKTRDMSVREKLNPVKSEIAGKRVVLIDDSIVRGTTMRRIVQMVRNAGAKEVHVRVGSPPIIAPCYLGIDMTTRDQFVATGKTVPEIAKEIGADSVGYISIDGLLEALRFDKNDVCLGCVSAEYPIKIEGEKERFQQRLM